MKRDAEFGGVVPHLSAGEILASTDDLELFSETETVEFGSYPGPHVTESVMWELKTRIDALLERPEIGGVVVTHGTDTLEETAYFLDCCHSSDKPVVLVGSMRNSSEPDWDGPRNLRDAVSVAADPQCRNLGVLVCLNETVLAASEATKIDTTSVQTFESPDFGVLGRVTNGRVSIYRKPVHRDILTPNTFDAFVPIITCYASSEGFLVEASVQGGAQGIVIEAMGVGNVPPAVYRSLLPALESNTPVVLVSRCPIGRVEHVYAYEGAGRQLYNSGVIFADYLNAQKARIKLKVALGANVEGDDLRNLFEWSIH